MTKTKKINFVVISTAVIINTILMILTLMGKYNSNIFSCLILYSLLFIPILANKIFKIKIPTSVELIFLLFIFISVVLGSIAHFYTLIPWFDSFTHFISGILTAFFSLQLLVLFNKYNKKDKLFNTLFIISFTLMVASFWEIFEFCKDIILDNDSQRVIETGVFDTMKDIICALLGSLLFIVNYIYDVISGKNKLKKFVYSIKK